MCSRISSTSASSVSSSPWNVGNLELTEDREELVDRLDRPDLTDDADERRWRRGGPAPDPIDMEILLLADEESLLFETEEFEVLTPNTLLMAEELGGVYESATGLSREAVADFGDPAAS